MPADLPHDLPEVLWDELTASQRLGLIGPRPLADHVAHAAGFAASGSAPRMAADLGSGGGLPALVLAAMWPSSEWVLIDVRQRAVARLDVMIARLGWVQRVRTWLGPAEVAGRDPVLRGAFDLVTARGLGPPAMTAECGAPLLAPSGHLVVSEAPEGPNRWPAEALADLNLRVLGSPGPSHVVLQATAACPSAYPRREGRPRARPLW